MIRAVIAGPSECGKTTLARAILSREWRRHRRRGLVFDPHLRAEIEANGPTWGPGVLALKSFARFDSLVWRSRGFVVVMDEGTSAINRDKTFTRYFTEIRHFHGAFYVMAHDSSVLLPIMRQSLTEGFIFRQTRDSAEKWAGVFVDEALRAAADLGRFEFLHKRAFLPVQRCRPTLAELAKW